MPTTQGDAFLVAANGSVYVEREGTRITLNKGDAIFAADTIITASETTADIRFRDGATAKLSPNTTLVVKDFVYGDEDPSFILQLVKGAMRSISGEVVRQNPDAFRIETPRSTVGIRGTELYNAVTPDGQEIHAVIFVSEGHVVTVTASNGERTVLDTPLQTIQISADDSAPWTIQQYSVQEMETTINNVTPGLGGSIPHPQGLGLPNTNDGKVLIVDLNAPGQTADVTTLQTLLEQLQVKTITVAAAPEQLGLSSEEPLDSLLETTPVPAQDLVTQVLGQDVPLHAQDTASTETVSAVAQSAPLHFTYPTGISNESEATRHLDAPGHSVETHQKFTISSLTTGFWGNAKSITIGADKSVRFGDDIISIDNSQSAPGATPTTGAGIVGDAEVIISNGASSITFGNDTIHVGTAIGILNIYGDSKTMLNTNIVTIKGGNDTITVDTVTNGGLHIEGGYGNDTILVKDFTGSRAYASQVDGGEGDDSITVQQGSIGAGTLHLTGGAGADTFTVGNIDGKVVITDFDASQGDTLHISGPAKVSSNNTSPLQLEITDPIGTTTTIELMGIVPPTGTSAQDTYNALVNSNAIVLG